MATKPSNTSNAPMGLRDAAYRFASNMDTGRKLAAYVMEQDPGFPDNAREDTLADLKAGFTLRYSENNPGMKYIRKGEDVYVPAPEGAKDADCLTITVAYAMGFSGQEFGKLRGTQPNLHGLISTVRDAVSSYVSATLKNLRNAATGLLPGKKRQRGVNKDWADRMTAQFTAMETSIAKAKKRGDTTAPEDAAYKKAVAAFWAALK